MNSGWSQSTVLVLENPACRQNRSEPKQQVLCQLVMSLHRKLSSPHVENYLFDLALHLIAFFALIYCSCYCLCQLFVSLRKWKWGDMKFLLITVSSPDECRTKHSGTCSVNCFSGRQNCDIHHEEATQRTPVWCKRILSTWLDQKGTSFLLEATYSASN